MKGLDELESYFNSQNEATPNEGKSLQEILTSIGAVISTLAELSATLATIVEPTDTTENVVEEPMEEPTIDTVEEPTNKEE